MEQTFLSKGRICKLLRYLRPDECPSTNVVTARALNWLDVPVEETASATCDCQDDCVEECKGKVTELTLSYLGTDAAYIEVYEGKDPKPEKNVFSGQIQPGDPIKFNGTLIGRDDTLGAEISVFVDGVQNTKIHTSCSQPIGPGLISGDFEVIEGVSREGGPLCPI